MTPKARATVGLIVDAVAMDGGVCTVYAGVDGDALIWRDGDLVHVTTDGDTSHHPLTSWETGWDE